MYLGALISILDVLTDVDTIIRFYNEGNNHFAIANLVFIAVSLLLHLIATVGQNRNKVMKVITFEVLIVLSMIKPAWDAKKVASGDDIAKDALMHPQMESTMTKVSY